MSKTFIRFCSGILIPFILLTLAACGITKDETAQSVVSMSAVQHEDCTEIEGSSLLLGMYCSVITDGKYYEAEISDNDIIMLDMVHVQKETDSENNGTDGETTEGTETLWVGTCIKPEDDDVDVFCFKSQRDGNSDMEYTAESMYYSYYADGDELRFTAESVFSEEIHLFRCTDVNDIIALGNTADENVASNIGITEETDRQSTEPVIVNQEISDKEYLNEDEQKPEDTAENTDAAEAELSPSDTDTVPNESPSETVNTADNSEEPTTDTENTQAPVSSGAEASLSTPSDSYTSGGFPLYNYGVLDGSYLGRARIPDVDIDVAIYNSLSQSVCDAWDSACFAYAYQIPSEGNYSIVFADHQNQGFSAIKNCSIGSVLYIDGTDGNTYKYICDWIDYNGRNDSVYLYNSSGQICDNGGGLYAYTCNDYAGNVTIVHFSAA